VPEFERLLVWQKAHQLTLEAYPIAARLPETEKFALADQIRRAAISVPANIAEGQGRVKPSEFRPFVSVAKGSVCELQALVLVARDLDYLGSHDLTRFWSLTEEVTKMLGALYARLSKA
jgi:four helix bundle protein